MSIFEGWIYWLQFVGIAVGAVALFLVAVAVFGWERVKGLLLPLLGLLAVFGYRAKLQQSGYRDRRAEEEKALDKAEDFVDDQKQDVHRLPDAPLDDEIDRWSRK